METLAKQKNKKDTKIFKNLDEAVQAKSEMTMRIFEKIDLKTFVTKKHAGV